MSPLETALLFGLLALQKHFITRKQLLAALADWLHDQGTPLGMHLHRRGILESAELPLLAQQLTDHRKRHGDASLSALQVEADIWQAVAQLDESIAAVSRARGTTPGSSHADETSLPSPPPKPLPTLGRFVHGQFHARGGLGEVFRAEDQDFHRTVALKQIRTDRDDDNSRSRFLMEAEITGQLEHPGIVAVYARGAHEDGRPYYAMRFIDGESLQEALAAFHRGDKDPKRDGRERALSLRRLLNSFVAVCQVLAYAHARGVIHRDLKPANVMLGRYGETLVVDWGLARKTTSASPDETSPSRPVVLSPQVDSSATVMGEAIGTPRYIRVNASHFNMFVRMGNRIGQR